MTPARAAVRPLVTNEQAGASGDGPRRLDDALADLLPLPDGAAVAVVGGPGAGTSTALRHLAAVLPPDDRTTLLDTPTRTELARALAGGPVVYAAARLRIDIDVAHTAVYRLALWGDDELIEYTLAVHPARCASVMRRVLATTDRSRLQGIPELWSLALDALARDDALADAHAALRAALALVSPAFQTRRAGRYALERLLGRGPTGQAPGQPRWLGTRMGRALRHRPVQVLLGAERLAEDLAAGDVPWALAHRFPTDLIDLCGRDVRGRPGAVGTLAGLLTGRRSQNQPMAASVLHAAGAAWRPPAVGAEDTPVPLLDGAHLPGVVWPSSKLTGLQAKGATLSRADLSSSELSRADLTDANLARADLRGAVLSEARLNGANLRYADLTNARLDQAHLDRAVLAGATLVRASMRGIRLKGGSLAGAALAGADLHGAMLDAVDVEDADLSGADLTEAKLLSVRLRHARNLAGVCLRRAELLGCDLEWVTLPPGACLEGAVFLRTDLTGSSLPRADLRGAVFEGCGLAETDWPGADLRGADLRTATFHMGSSRSGLVFSPIACEGSRTGFYTDEYHEQTYRAPEEIRKANLRGADLRGAQTEGVDFYLVDLREARFDETQRAWFRRCGAILFTKV